jgi:HEAT repeat protein
MVSEPPRLSAAKVLGSLSELEADERVRVIERCLHDPSAELRMAAVAVGAELLDDETLVRMVRDGTDPVRRNGGLEMLKRRGRRAIGVATRLLADRDSDVVLQAVMILSAVGDGGVSRAVAELLLHDNPNVVQAAIVALGRGGQAMVPLLVPFLEGDEWLRVAAVEALGEIGGSAAARAIELVLPDESLEQVAVRALARCGGARACRALAECVEARGGGDVVQMEALAEALEHPGARLSPSEAMAALLQQQVAAGCEAAARCVLRLRLTNLDAAALSVLAGGAGSGSPLPACLNDRDDLVPALLEHGGVRKEWGLWLAARFPRPAVVSSVAEALRDAAWRLPAELIARAVMALDSAALAPALIRCYAQLPPSARAGWGPVLEHYRRPIMMALPECGALPGDAAAVLGTLLDDPAAAAAAIVELEGGAQVEAIAAALMRPDVLRRLPWMEWLKSAPDVFGSLAIVGAEAARLRSELPAIRQLLSTSREPALVRLIAELRDEESVPLLLDLLHGRARGLRVVVLDAVGRIGGSVARGALRDMLETSDAADRFVYRAFAACAEPGDLSLLRAGLKHTDWHVRMVCLDAVGAKGGPEDRARMAVLCADPVPAVAGCARKWLTV